MMKFEIASLAFTLAASGASADELPEVLPVEEVVVTAQHRREPIGETPIAISAFDGSFVERARLDDIKDLVAFAPGFAGASDDSYIEDLAVRGIASNDYGIGGEPSIGIFKDGIHQGRTGSAVTSLYDIERGEALRGPQGFLFGRNAISGAISVVTRKPEFDRWSGVLAAGYGEPDRVEFDGAVNIPLGPNWAMRMAGYLLNTDGWIDNAATPGHDRIMHQSKAAGRVSLRYERGALNAWIIGEHEHRRLDGTPYRAANADREVIDAIDAALGTRIVVRGDGRSIDSDLLNPRDDGDISSLTAQAELDLGFATLTGIAGYRGHRFVYEEDYDGTAEPFGIYRQFQSGTYASGELRLVSSANGPLSWTVGLSAYRETVNARFTDEADERYICLAGYGYASCGALTQDLFGTVYTPSADGMFVQPNHARNVATGVSAYGDVNYWVLPRLQLGAGLRYSWDRKRFALDVPQTTSSLGNIWTFTYRTDGFVEDARSWQGVTPRLYLRWKAEERVSIYASVSRGYKAGGFGTFTLEAPSPIDDFGLVPTGTRPDAFDPETVWSKELGIKASLAQGRLHFDLVAFDYLYSNLQTNFYNTETRAQEVINIGEVRGRGIEAALTARPATWFDLRSSLTWTRTRTRGDRGCALDDCGGLTNPEWASNGVATFRYPLGPDEASLSIEWMWQGKSREAWDWRGIVRRDPAVVANLVLGYRWGRRVEANVYVQNLFDKLWYQGVLNGGDLDPASVWGVSQPRNIGINIRIGGRG
ncbi:TonB-dependent receptor [Sphingomonas suaedae]|uniref:TonB-dependent receptor n=1 Tax=Sphingomonas suaedae TaxID=2599297 RepID=A0A518RCQ6_9SPHN|nr:TonB-dependent receptor [Sphingomonas suaedae]QDX25248.1 TonB-dependent receptor [Sphingomonas suaedae]